MKMIRAQGISVATGTLAGVALFVSGQAAASVSFVPSFEDSGGTYTYAQGISISKADKTNFDAFDLYDPGDSHTFDFLDVTFGHEGWVDTSSQVKAGLAFDTPDVDEGIGEGEVTRSTTWLGTFDGGTFEWFTQPGHHVATDGTEFYVEFSEFDVKPEWEWTKVGSKWKWHWEKEYNWNKYQTIEATVTLKNGPSQVPAPGVLGLLGAGLLGLAVAARRRR